jgi:hypothetical protein
MQAKLEMWIEKKMKMAMDKQKDSECNYGSNNDVDIFDPGKCQTNFDWDKWQIAFANKLIATMGAAKIPINCIICCEWDDHDELVLDNNKMRQYYQMLLTGEKFKHANNSCSRYCSWLVSSLTPRRGSRPSVGMRNYRRKRGTPWLATTMVRGN